MTAATLDATTMAALGEPSRLRIVELLRAGPRAVGEIADGLGIRQPQASKHLRVLGAAGFVDVEPRRQRRIYRLRTDQFDAIGDWVQSFERLWETRLDNLDGLLRTFDDEGKTMANKPTDEAAVNEKIGALPAFRDVAARLHEVITDAAPVLQPRLWYGMPGYATAKKSPVLCFFRVDDDRYVTFGLTEHAHHRPDADAGHQLMGSAWFLTGLDASTEARVADIVRHAVA